MIDHGLDGELIHATGVGSRNATTQCPDGGSKSLIACSQLDRRFFLSKFVRSEMARHRTGLR